MSEERVLLAHGDGGELMGELIERVFVSRLGTGEPAGDDSARLLLGQEQSPAERDGAGDDSARLAGSGRLVFTTDGFVVDPIFFPGGDIGKLAVCGTVNDLAAAGARPVALSASFILEEGLLISDLERIVGSMGAAAEEAEDDPLEPKYRWYLALIHLAGDDPHAAMEDLERIVRLGGDYSGEAREMLGKISAMAE